MDPQSSSEAVSHGQGKEGIADGDHIVPSVTQERLDGLRAVGADVDPELSHRLDREGMDPSCLGSGARHLDGLTAQVSQEALRHLTSGRVVGAQEQHPGGSHRTSEGSEAGGNNHRITATANTPAITCATMNPGTSTGRIPANESLTARASVTAGFANEVDAVNQYAALMYAATAIGTAPGRHRAHVPMMRTSPNVATTSLKSCAGPARACP